MNPLQKHFRQPKIYISLPSKGVYYEPGALTGDPLAIPVFAMTGMDELIMKTPDALFSGEATVKLIESCCPDIKNAKSVPSIDVDTILSAIRISTFGNDLSITSTCKACKTENDYDIDLHQVIEHYANIEYDNVLELDDLTVYFKPLLYHETSKFNVENFKLQKILGQLYSINDVEQRQQQLDIIYNQIANIQVNVFLSSIESVRMGDISVTDRDHISEWISNCDRHIYEKVKHHLEVQKERWTMPSQTVVCNNCETTDTVEILLDQSHFFE